MGGKKQRFPIAGQKRIKVKTIGAAFFSNLPAFDLKAKRRQLLLDQLAETAFAAGFTGTVNIA